MINNKAIDTNILIYICDKSNRGKRPISESLLADGPLVSSQVVSEFLNTTKRLLKLSKEATLEKCLKALSPCKIIPVEKKHLNLALLLIRKYDFQLFDSIIVASALESGCSTLYSEDMQHKQVIENKLTIINPFL